MLIFLIIYGVISAVLLIAQFTGDPTAYVVIIMWTILCLIPFFIIRARIKGRLARFNRPAMLVWMRNYYTSGDEQMASALLRQETGVIVTQQVYRVIRSLDEYRIIQNLRQSRDFVLALIRKYNFVYPFYLPLNATFDSLQNWDKIPSNEWRLFAENILGERLAPVVVDMIKVAVHQESIILSADSMEEKLAQHAPVHTVESWIQAYVANYPDTELGRMILGIVLGKNFSEIGANWSSITPKIIGDSIRYMEKIRYQESLQRGAVEVVDQGPPVAQGLLWWRGSFTGPEFERWVADLLREHGYAVETTKATGDQGADLIVTGKGIKTVVQVKFWSQPVGNSAVQEVVAAKPFYNAEDAWVVTNSTFTRSAIELAHANGVTLIDGGQLRELWSRISQ